MNVALYHCRLPAPGRKPGGAEVYVDRLARALGRRGHEVTVLSYDEAAPGDGGYAVRALRPRTFAEHKLARQYLTPLRMNAWRLDGHDVLHLFGDDWLYVRRRLPTVRTFLGSALFEMATATSARRRADQALLTGLEWASSRLATAAYGIGVESHALGGRDGILDPGVTLAPSGERRPSAAPSVLFVGTWAGRKRGELLQRAFADVRRAVPDAELWMVSDRAAPAAGVRHVAVPGDAELADLYRRAWIFCLPSSYEGFGLPYLEAMAAGCPVVATPNGGAVRVLGEAAGRIVEPAGLGAALTALLTDAPERERLAQAGRARAAHFTWNAAVDQHEAAYRLAVDRWRRRRTARPRTA